VVERNSNQKRRGRGRAPCARAARALLSRLELSRRKKPLPRSPAGGKTMAATAAPGATSSLPGAVLEPEEPVLNRVIFDLLSALLLCGTALLGSYIPLYLSERAAEEEEALARAAAAAAAGDGAAAPDGALPSFSGPGSPSARARARPASSMGLAFHLGNCLSAGVMLSAGFCHLLADSLRKLAFVGRFPITPFLAATGYLLTLCADQLVQAVAAAAGRRAAAEAAGAQGAPLLGGAGGGGVGVGVGGVGRRAGGGGGGRYGAVPGVDADADAGDRMERAQPSSSMGLAKLRVPPPPLYSASAGAALPLPAQPPTPSLLLGGGHPPPPSAPASDSLLLLRGNGADGYGHGPSDGDLGTSAYTSAYSGGGGGTLTPRRAAAAAAEAATSEGGGGHRGEGSAGGSRLGSPERSPRRHHEQHYQQPHRHVVELVDVTHAGGGGGAAVGGGAGRPAGASLASSFAPGATAHPPPPPPPPRNPASVPTTTVVAARLASGALGGVGPDHRPPGPSGASFSSASGGAGASAGGLLGPAPHHPHHHDAAGISALASPQHKLNFGTALLLAAALCVHSVLEGIALGAQQTLRDTEDIMLAIAAHKGLAAYALGASVVESGASAARFWTVAGLFAGATPVGIFVGLLFSEIGSGSVGAAMSALASGTFLYVAMMEVIPKELADPSHMGLKMSALLLGFGAMSLLAVWA